MLGLGSNPSVGSASARRPFVRSTVQNITLLPGRTEDVLAQTQKSEDVGLERSFAPTRLEKEVIRAAMQGELAPRDPSVKLFAAVDDYLQAKEATANSRRTIEFDRERLEIVKRHLEDVKLTTITRKTIEGFQQSAGSKVPATERSTWTSVRSAR
jgi:hypothetical protein